jgi:hypothetical protein
MGVLARRAICSQSWARALKVEYPGSDEVKAAEAILNVG